MRAPPRPSPLPVPAALMLAPLALALLPAVSGCGWISKGDLDERLDLDGDGVPRPEDCDDDDDTVTVPLFFVDNDADGFGDAGAAMVPACALRIGLAELAGDCDDADDDVWPGAPELCNERDDDCDGSIDEEAIDKLLIGLDADGDGFGDPATATEQCAVLDGFVDNIDDCDDGDAAVGGVLRWFEDGDGDGFGRAGSLTTIDACTPPPNRVPRGGDCDDSDEDVNPGAEERCDPDDRDEDCDGLADDEDPDAVGQLDYYRDEDMDGLGDPRTVEPLCDPNLHAVSNADDCDDSNSFVGAEDCPWVNVSAGGTATCGLRADARVRCWGTGPVVDSAPAELRFDSVAVGDAHACGLALDGLLRCWGEVAGRTPTVPVPVSAVDVEAARTCATAPEPSGALSCWSAGEEHQVRLVAGALRAPAAGVDHGCGLADVGMRCAGDCAGPHCAPQEGSFALLAAGDGFSCALNQETGLVCWGDAAPGLTGRGGVAAMSAYGRQLCLLDESGDASCLSADTGLEVAALVGAWEVVAAGREHGCGLDVTGEIRCWGSDANGAASPPLP